MSNIQDNIHDKICILFCHIGRQESGHGHVDQLSTKVQ
jgi:hypothetical protein